MLQVSIPIAGIQMASVQCCSPWQGRRRQGSSHPWGQQSPHGFVFVKHILLCKPQEILRSNSGCYMCGKLRPTQLRYHHLHSLEFASPFVPLAVWD